MLDSLCHLPTPPVLATGMQSSSFFGIAAACTAATLACIGLQKNIFGSLCKDLKLACKSVARDKNAVAKVAYELGLLKGSSFVMLLCSIINWFNTVSVAFSENGNDVPGLTLYAGVLTVTLFLVVILLTVWHACHRYSSL